MSTLPGDLKDKRFYSELPRQGKVILVIPLKSLVIRGLGISNWTRHFTKILHSAFRAALFLGVLP